MSKDDDILISGQDLMVYLIYPTLGWNALSGALVTVLLTIIFSLILGNYNLMKNEYYAGFNKG